MTKSYTNFWRIAPCLFTIIVDYMGLGLVYPIITEMFTEVPSTVFPKIHSATAQDFYMSLAFILYPFFMFFGASFLGDLSDFLGRKKVLLIALTGILISFIIMTLGIKFHLISIFLIGRAFSGLMAGSQPLCMAAIADVSTPESKARNMSLVTLTNCIGLIIGPFIGGVFTENYFLQLMGFSFPFMLAALFALVGIALVAFLFKETFEIPLDVKRKIVVFRPLTIFVEAFKSHRVTLLVLIVFLQMLGFMVYYQTSGVYLRETFHASSALLGFFYAFMGVFFACGVLIVIPYVLKHYSLEGIVSFHFFLNGLSAFLAILWQNPLFIWLITIPFAFSNATGFTAIATIFSNSTTPEKQGWIMGVLGATVAASYIVSGASANMIPHLGTRGVIAIGGIAGMVSGLLMIYYSHHIKKDVAQ